MGNHNKILFISLFLFLTLGEVAGQGRSDNFWIFGGSGQGLQFGLGDDSLTDNTIETAALGNQGSAVAADPNTGDIYFYTDGNQIFDGQGNPIAVPGGLNGNGTGSQPVVIVPDPNDDISDGVREYFLYVNVGSQIYQHTATVTTSPDNYPTVTVSTANGPLGSALGSSQAMTVVPSADGSTYYVVAQQAGTADFFVIDVATDPTTATVVSPGIPGNITATNMEYNPATGQLAVAFNGGVHVLASDGVGGLTFNETVGTGQNVFDVAWSPDGSKLYYSTGIGGSVFQHDFTTGNPTVLAGVGGTANYGLQTGPDGSVYHLYQTPNGVQLGVISMADSAAALVTYEDGLLGGTDFVGQQFSQVAFATQGDLSFTITQAGQCTNNPVQLIPEFAEGTPTPDSIIWVLPNGEFTGYSPTFTPEEASGQVFAVAYWDNDSAIAQLPLTLQELDLQIPIVQDTTICPGDSITLNAEPESGQGGGQPGTGGGTGGNYSYLWSTGEDEAEIIVDEAGVYWVLVTDQSTGCTAYAESNVKEYQVPNQTYNVWYFGNSAGIDFNNLYDNPNNPDDNGDGVDNDGQVVGLGDGASTAPEGVEAISDASGDPLFYTDGRTLYFVNGGTHTEVPDITGAPVDLTEGAPAGASATMVGMVQVPGTDAAYYIFTSTPVEGGGNQLRYAVVNLNGSVQGTPEPRPVIVSDNNILFSPGTERITIQGGRGGPATLLVHEYGNNAFRSYPITEQGIGNPVISSVGSNHDLTNPEDARGYMKFGGDSTGTVVGVVADNRVEIFNYDSETLELSNPTIVPFDGLGTPYGLEFQSDSVGNTVVIVSTDNGIYVASVERPLEEGATVNFQPVSGASGVFGAIQQGSDGQLYVAQEGATGLGTVSGNVNDPSSYTYQADQVQLPAGATVGRGLPSYIDQGGSSFPEPNITVDDACVGNETQFSAQGRDDVIETYEWVIVRLNEDGTESFVGLSDSLRSEQSFSFAIDTLGNYEARVTLSNPCEDDTVLVQQFTMGTAPEVTLEEDASANLCGDGIEITAIDSGDVSGLTFQWIRQGAVGGGNLPPTNTITATEPGLYTVTVINADSCTSEGEIFVVDIRPPVELGEDFTLCQNEERELDVEIPDPADDDAYQWLILDQNDQVITSSDEPAVEVSDLTPNPGVYQYTVTVNAADGCFNQDTVVVTILESPEIEGTVTNSECGVPSGEIQLNILSDPNETYSFVWTDRDGNQVGTTEDVSGLAAGVYTVAVSNSIGCTTTEQFAISDANADFTVEVEPQEGCDDTGTLLVTITPDDPSTFTGVNWAILDEGGAVAFSGTNSSGLTFTIPEANPPAGNGLAPGSFGLEFESLPGLCIQADTLTIPEPDSVDFDLPGLRVFCEPTEVAALDPDTGEPLDPLVFNFTWTNVTPGATANAGLSNPTQNRTVISQAGTYEVEVTPIDPADTRCPATQDVEVTFETPPTIQAIVELEDNSCEEGEKVIGVEFAPEVVDTGDLIYEWQVALPDGTVQTNIGATQNITISRTGDYSVNVRRRGGNATCTSAASPLPVVVNQPLSVLILFGSACDDGTDIPLIARVTTDGTDSLRYEWYDSANVRLPASGDTLLLRPDMPAGEYRVVVTQLVDGADGCTAETSADVTRSPVPETNLGEGPFVICPRDPDPEANSVLLEVSFAPNILWTTPFGTFDNTVTLPANQGGTYVVEITNEFGCTTIDSVEVIEDCTPTIVAPNAFRPNGVNSEFFVYPRYVSDDDFEVRIYNRWGELVFQSNNRDFRWDGTYNGQPAPLGSYPYVITFKSDTDGSNDILEERGGVTIIR
ncbi:gliding motility-associated C-terminal domain-containing protein [Tunicatimonas pelagia]|uniref:gliding motility-associated C-terminal domain-containing protein n=1 Tax=Tunicatimonas pelagia TaxID=931531 RepID=UPI0026664B1C|nr:gliding motility-associated C-terminal domain-containing protein [Tunicatimonas pelagia]WKN41408.1 gliding motility-associated C-terminal domain-containing protein [Tunicatimonas pelagia]